MNEPKNIVFETMLKEAVTVNFKAKMRVMPSEEDLLREHPPSAEHIRKMKALFAWERREAVMKRVLSFARAAVIVLCITATILFAALLINREVRAAVRDTIVQIFEGFTRIEFTKSDEPTGEARDYSPEYIPDGYTLESVTEYGFNCLTIYTDTGGNMLMLDVGPLGAYAIDNDYHSFSSVHNNGTTYHVNEAHDAGEYSMILWERDGMQFDLQGAANIEELTKMAYSIICND